MIVGSVNHRRQAFVDLGIVGVGGLEATVTLLFDTGFNGGLSLPIATIQLLGLTEGGLVRSQLADGSWIEGPWFRANVIWDDSVRPTSIIVTQGQPLLGMALVAGHQLTIDWVDGGSVIVRRLE